MKHHTKGILLDRAEDPDDKHIVLKLNSGYNVGIDVGDALQNLFKNVIFLNWNIIL